MMVRLLGALVAVGVTVAPVATAQEDGLATAVEGARAALRAHDAQRLVEASDTLRLQIPGVAASAAFKPGQAARLLDRYLQEAEEKQVALLDVRRLADDHAYAELERQYVVRGTEEARSERVFLGFRRLAGTWRLREVRVTR